MDNASRNARRWRPALLAALLPFALATPAQSGLDWRGQTANAAQNPWSGAIRRPQPGSLPFDIGNFEAMAQQLVADGGIPGLAVAIVQDGRVLSARGYGATSARGGEPVDAHTVFRIASLSKSFASTMTGLLVNDGALRWDSRIVDYVPDFRLSWPGAEQQVTMADLLSHRVGLSRNAYDRDLERNADFQSLKLKLASAPMTCAPGQCYAYQNVAFSLIGEAVQAASGLDYGEAVRQRIFQPLGMHDASVGLAGLESSPRWARPHVRAGSGWNPLMPKPTYYRVAPAAGVNASISDMAQWLIAQSGHRTDVLPAPLLATLHSPLVETPSESRSTTWRRARVGTAGYALGWRVFDYAGHPLYFHGGAVQGYRGAMALLPDRDLGIAILWNSESPLPSALLPTILDSALGIVDARWMEPDAPKPTDTLFADRPLQSTTDETDASGADSSSANAAPR